LAGNVLFLLKENSCENVHCDSLMEAARYQVCELLELFLLIIGMLGLLDKSDYLLLNIWRQI